MAIHHAPPTDLVTTKEISDNLKIKLPNGTIFNMSIFSQGSTKEYLANVVAVLHLINQKGLNLQCRKLAKTVDKLTGTLDNLQKPNGPKGAIPRKIMMPTSWSSSRPKRCLKKPGRLTTRLLPRRTSP
jgi:hypothetical protein